MRWILLFLLPFGVLGSIPDTNTIPRTPGTYVGVIGGMRARTTLIDVTQAPYNVDNTGVLFAHSGIQAAIDAATAGEVVYLPPGRYLIGVGLDIAGLDNITLRGAGTNTVLVASNANVKLFVGADSDFDFSQPTTTDWVTAGIAKGSTNLTITDTTDFGVGKLLRFAVLNDSNLVTSVTGYEYMSKQMLFCTNLSGSILTTWPPLHDGHLGQSYLTGRVNAVRIQSDFVGIENFKMEWSNSTATAAIHFSQTYSCWISNVVVEWAANYPFQIYNSLNWQMRNCVGRNIRGSGSNRAGLLANNAHNGLVESIYVTNAFPGFEINEGSSGNVFAYSMTEDSGGGAGIDSNHGPHNSHNLYEGNISPVFQCDGYFGGAAWDIVFRCWFHGTHPSVQQGACISLNRFARFIVLAANVFGWVGNPEGTNTLSFGNPNMGDGNFTGTASDIGADYHVSRNVYGVVTNRVSDTACSVHLLSGAGVTKSNGISIGMTWTGGNHTVFAAAAGSNTTELFLLNGSVTAVPANGTSVRIWGGPESWQEQDQDVSNTVTRIYNYYASQGTVPSEPEESLPDSLYLDSAPSWWPQGMTFPPFNPSTVNTNNLLIHSNPKTPAQFYHVNGYWPTGDVSVVAITNRPPRLRGVRR